MQSHVHKNTSTSLKYNEKGFCPSAHFFSFLKINCWGNQFWKALCFRAQRSIRFASPVHPLGLVWLCLKPAMLLATGQRGLNHCSCLMKHRNSDWLNQTASKSCTLKLQPSSSLWLSMEMVYCYLIAVNVMELSQTLYQRGTNSLFHLYELSCVLQRSHADNFGVFTQQVSGVCKCSF